MDTKPQIEHLYRFNYAGKKRVALLLSVDGGTLSCYDFLSDGGAYRKFYEVNITAAEDVTENMKVVTDRFTADKYAAAGYKVYFNLGKYFIVNV